MTNEDYCRRCGHWTEHGDTCDTCRPPRQRATEPRPVATASGIDTCSSTDNRPAPDWPGCTD